VNEAGPSLPDAVAGHVERWVWQPGLGPDAVAAALGAEVAPGDILHAGHQRRAASIRIPDMEWPLWAVWERSGDLVLLEVVEPPEAPTEAQALEAYGEPDARIDHTEGPYPGYEQLAYLSRGFTLFVWGSGHTAYLWLYKPTEYDAYVSDLGATTSPTRPSG
jgi:hypothetical protein